MLAWALQATDDGCDVWANATRTETQKRGSAQLWSKLARVHNAVFALVGQFGCAMVTLEMCTSWQRFARLLCGVQLSSLERCCKASCLQIAQTASVCASKGMLRLRNFQAGSLQSHLNAARAGRASARAGFSSLQPAGARQRLRAAGQRIILAHARASSWPALYILRMTSRGGGVWGEHEAKGQGADTWAGARARCG